MDEDILAEIRLFAGNFAPRGWAFCQGQLLSISQNTALFSLLGTMYGGNGQTTFALPDLRGRVAIGQGQGPGLTPHPIGELGGSETITLLANNLPAHNHAVSGAINMLCYTGAGNSDTPHNNYPARLPGTDMYATSTNGSVMPAMQHNLSVSATGASQAINNMQPVLALNYIICMQGIYPPRP
ncbi:phage tail protein [Niastella sp. OAS944]|uniref:phage tail protein n=1 Tax=Niastella sp. OAS944 TaxID=2664089 RepID=UPI00348469A2|nr:microcystin-dependent protein [Chitinophagaceae bacterium OAS944]